MIANSDDCAKPQEVSTSLKILSVFNLTAFSSANSAVDSKAPVVPMVPSRQIWLARTAPVVQGVPVTAQ